jgi:poly-beta-1,6-N-acetyl-D-glucosamine synthase
MAMASLPQYVLITPARNEAQFIGLTLQSMVRQTVPPLRWIIVSDGSTDGTDEIVATVAAKHPWLELLRMPERRERHFAGKVYAFNAGLARVASLDYEVIGNLDADISFEPDYLAFLLNQFAANPRLGVAGTPYQERNTQYDYRFANIEDVAGACQLFRRKCFEEIGGYVPLKGGLVDTVAVRSARMKGWQTRTFPDRVCVHHRESGTAERGALVAKFARGEKAYAMGSHPLWEVCRTVYQMSRRPYVVGGLALLSGYLWSLLRRTERPVPPELMAFQRREQMQRLRRIFTGRWFVGDSVS